MSDGLTIKAATLPQGAMPPLHARDAEEGYVVLDGEVSFYVGNDVVHAKAGDAVVVPAGVPRSFRVTSTTARWRVLAAVSPSGYEDLTPAAKQPTGASGEEAAAGGIEVLAPPGMLPARQAA
jgi:quercetin dioxygenase-like cupin family protein